MKTGRKERLVLSLLVLLLFLAAPAADASAADAGLSRLPLWLAEESLEPGRVEIVEYVNCYGYPLYAGVYLPYGYSEETIYDVAVIWGGTLNGYDEVFNFTYPCYFKDDTVKTLTTIQLLDRMIEKERIRPVIVVCMEDIGNINISHADLDIDIMLDYVKEHYSTYASVEGISQEELREHFFLWGFSQGAIFTQSAGMGFHFDDFASFAAVSYGSDWGVIQGVTESPYELSLFYACVGGRFDHGADSTRSCYDIIVNGCGDKITDGENALLRQAEEYNHSFGLMLAAMYDYLPRMLPVEREHKPWMDLMELYYSGYSPRRNS